MLLASKLAAPPSPSGLVARQRLNHFLDVGTGKPLTLLTAPAGWGKTTLLAAWSRGRCAWLTAEPGDDTQFWRYVGAALNTPPPEDRSGLALLADELSRRPDPVSLVLDDAQHLRDPELFHGLEFVTRHASGRLRLIISARSEPPFTLHRWRLPGELTQLRAGDLAFTRSEAAELLAGIGVRLPTVDLERLHARTEGWPVGLRLAGDELAIADYLIQEVLAGQPTDIRELLLSTSILERLSGDLVNALTGRGDGERILAELEHANTFIQRVDAQPLSHRYHGMFAELLRAELRRSNPGRISDLHAQAARWFAAHELAAEALRHALAAGDAGFASDLVTRQWPDLAPYGHVPAVHPELAGEVTSEPANPALALAFAADHLAMRDADGAGRYLAMAEPDRELTPAVEAFKLQLALVKGDTAAIQAAPDPPEHATLGVAQLLTGEMDAACRTLTDGARRTSHGCAHLRCTSTLSLALAMRGDLSAAVGTAHRALALPSCAGQSGSVHRGHAHLALAVAGIQRDQLADAQSHLELAAASSEITSELDLAAWLALYRAQMCHARGDLVAGHHALTAGRQGLESWRDSSIMEHRYTAMEADLHTAHGNHEHACQLLQPLPHNTSVELAVALARAQLGGGDPAAALRTLLAASGSGGPRSARLDADVLEALAAKETGDRRRARTALECALDLAEPEGFRWAFTRAGLAGRDLLAEHLDSGTAHWAFVEVLTSLVPPGPQAALAEALTRSELAVLRYLQSLLSYGEIASEMHLSVNTVKTHVRHVYRKLDVTRRRDAVRRARELRVL